MSGAPAKLVQPVHFEDFDGKQFERLAFAYFLRSNRWRSVEWYGQVGSDLGRDIWGVRVKDGAADERICIQCANRKRLPLAKALSDIDKAANGPRGTPDRFILVCACQSISAMSRDKIKSSAAMKGITETDVWSGPEFEERLRATCESLLRRFIHGDTFPDSPAEINEFVKETPLANDDEILKSLSRAFDRPAFHTPFHAESSIPGFKQAITDTIQVINTGVWQTRDGKKIGLLPSKHMIKNQNTRLELDQVVHGLEQLRARFDEFVRKGEIKYCGCNDPNCPVIFFHGRHVEQEMDHLRSSVLKRFSKVCPGFQARLGW